MVKSTSIVAAALVTISLAPASAYATLTESYPSGSQYMISSGADMGNPGGITFAYSNLPTNLYWGPDATYLPQAGLDNVLHQLSLTSISGDVATWSGTTSWADPTNGVIYGSVPLTLQITVTGLGANPWVTFSGANGSDPTGVGAVVNDPLGTNFSANLYLSASTVAGLLALNSVQQSPANSGHSVEGFSGAFYTPVPLPATAWLMLTGLGGLGAVMRRRRAAWSEALSDGKARPLAPGFSFMRGR
jgi:hypothetical protein